MRRKLLIIITAIIISILVGFTFLKYKSKRALENIYEMDYRLIKKQSKQMKLIDNAEFKKADSLLREFDTLEQYKTRQH